VALAFFNVADKLRIAGQSLMGPLSQALYPRISLLVNTDKQGAFALIKKSALVTLMLAGSASAILWLLADVLIILIAGDSFKQAAEILRWLAALPLIIGFSNLLGVQIMLAKSMSKPFNTILGVAAGLSVVLVWPLSYLFSGVGAAATLLIVEFFVTLCMAAYLWKKGYLANHLWRNE
jgi:O-antigen/teichoic acid export membrane protein